MSRGCVFNSQSFYSMKVLSEAQRPMVIVGSSILQREDGTSIYNSVFSLANKLKASKNVPSDWKTLNIMHRVRKGTDEERSRHKTNEKKETDRQHFFC